MSHDATPTHDPNRHGRLNSVRRIATVCVLVAATATCSVFLRPAVNAGKEEPAAVLVGDGRTDNTAAIFQLLRKDGTVVFPRGVYRITEPIVIDLDATGPVAITANGNATLRMDGP